MTIFKLLCVISLTLTAVSTLPIGRTVRDEAGVEVISEVGEETLTKVDANARDDNETSRMNNLMRMPDGFRPEMQVSNYRVEITPNIDEGTFEGMLNVQVSITDDDLRDEDLKFFVEDLEISLVEFALGGSSIYRPAADFGINEDDGTLDIETGVEGASYNLRIGYTGSLTTVGQGLYTGTYGEDTYLAMNLYAQNARRVFPSVDVPNHLSLISFSFDNVDSFNNIVMNSATVENEDSSFMSLRGPPHLWTMSAHSWNSLAQPTNNVFLYARPGVGSQESQASLAINSFFNNLNTWTDLNYFDIIPNQYQQLHILALPDISKNWYGLTSVGIWEPYVLMENACSVKQRFTALSKIGEALARQWYGYAIYPQNFRFEWVVSGLASYAGFDVLREFQTVPDNAAEDISMLDVHTLFVTEIIQESLLRDGYIAATVMETADNIFDQDEVRGHMNGILNYKAPAILRMLRNILGGPDDDFIQTAARSMLVNRQPEQPRPVNTLSFVDAIMGDYLDDGNGLIENIEEYLEPFVRDNGYPLLVVRWQQGGVSISLERFNYQRTTPSDYSIPITYSRSNSPNFEESNIYPELMSDNLPSIPMLLDDDDYVLFNVHGQGYYRVSYDTILWERILEALQDPERREEIHPLNRATLLDDALNLARGGRLGYDIAFEVVLTWEHETEYAPWKAFVRNMNFLRKRLVAMVEEDDDLDPDIYLRMVRRTIGSFEDEIGFIPDSDDEPAMTLLTRGLIMDHACRAGYQPCIAAALDLFYGDDDVVNPDIPRDIRPAVYCTAVREGEMDIIEALEARLLIESNMWERVVILESLACSTNGDYINELLGETLSDVYTTEERSKIFIAVAESSYENAQIAFDFLRMNDNKIREWYGGNEKLELIINELAENVVNGGFVERFHNYVTSTLNNLDDAELSAQRANAIAEENMEWERRLLDDVYEWIDENDAPPLMISLTLMILSFVVALVNH